MLQVGATGIQGEGGVISDVFIAINVKTGVFWNVTPCGGSERGR
jgi:hypothetical protein